MRTAGAAGAMTDATAAASVPPRDLRAARHRLLIDSVGVGISVAAFGFVYGLAAHNAGFSPIEAISMSVIPFAGAAQLAAVGYVAQGVPWIVIFLLTALLNARHLLYSASLAPRLRSVPLVQRILMAHVLTDEAFALSASYFHRIGRVDVPGYWIAAIVGVFIPWNLATIAGVLAGGAVPDPSRFGLDVVFPAAMGGLAVGLVTGRREIIAAGAGAAIGIILAVAVGPALGIIAGGVLGPAIAIAIPDGGGAQIAPDSDVAGIPVDLDEAALEIRDLEPRAMEPRAPEEDR